MTPATAAVPATAHPTPASNSSCHQRHRRRGGSLFSIKRGSFGIGIANPADVPLRYARPYNALAKNSSEMVIGDTSQLLLTQHHVCTIPLTINHSPRCFRQRSPSFGNYSVRSRNSTTLVHHQGERPHLAGSVAYYSNGTGMAVDSDDVLDG